MRRALILALLAGCLLPVPAARAADPGHWTLSGATRIPQSWYQGISTDLGGRIFVSGTDSLHLADLRLRRTALAAPAIPSEVRAAEGFNHIGDLSFDSGENGRLLLPLECYEPGKGNTCGKGAIGVSDPATLAWRYHVKLDPAEIPKAMWLENGDEGLVWTSSGSDLLAYRAEDIAPANAGAAGAPIRAVRRLPGAVPPSGVTGAEFRAGHLYLAGQTSRRFQIWKVNPASGARRLVVEQNLVCESEGITFADVLGGELQWMVQPLDVFQGRAPTFSTGVLLQFVRGGPRTRSALRVRAGRPSAGPGGTTRVSVDVASRGRPVRGALVTLAGAQARTSRRGRARLSLRLARSGRYRALAAKGSRLKGISGSFVSLRAAR